MFGIRKVEEGVTIEESSLPLDINHHKLLEWLVDRKQVPENWSDELDQLEKEIQYALDQLDASTKETLPSDLWMVPLERILREVEKEETGSAWITGSKRGRAWRRVVKHLKTKNLFMAHSARLLLSLVNYEIPAFNRQIERLRKQEAEQQRKKAEYSRIAAEETEAYRLDCAKYNLPIPCEDPQQRISDMAGQLPDMYAQVCVQIQDEQVKESLELYQTFTSFVLGEETTEEVCPVLRYLLHHGNELVTVMHRRQAGEEIPTSEEEAFVVVDAPGQETSSPGSPAAFHYVEDDEDGDDVPMGDPSAIQWDIDLEEEEEGEGHEEQPPVEINWDIDISTVDESGADDQANSAGWEISVEDVGREVDEHQLSEACVIDPTDTILESSTTRNQFLDDLYELAAFLKQRQEEVQRKEHLVLSSLLQSAPELITKQTVLSLEEMIHAIEQVIHALTSDNVRMILDIKASTRYVERLVSGLQRRQDIIKRMNILSSEIDARREATEENTMRIHLKKTAAVKEAIEIRAHLQHQLSSQVNRPVHIVGQINNILST